jgi:hypothetical protein
VPFSGVVGVETTSAMRVVEHAFRRCRLPAQAVTAEMQDYALQSLRFMLDELSNRRTPSWCIEQVLLPMYQNQPLVALPAGTVEVLNLHYRTLQLLSGTVLTAPTSRTVAFGDSTTVSSVGVKWSGATTALTFETSDDGVTWTTVGTANPTAAAGEITWFDINAALPAEWFRVTGASTLNYSSITLGNLPQDIPLGQLNRDTYSNQSNKIFAARPNSYYFQRNVARPVVYLWPAPNLAAESAVLVLWRHRQIMDTENLRQDVEVPRRWLEAIINGLAARVAAETPAVDAALVGVLEQRAAVSLQSAWDGDTDGSPTQINPGIGAYTR